VAYARYYCAMDKADTALSRGEILSALQALSDELGKAAVRGEICLFGGTAMVLAYSARVSTKDVDALFQPAEAVRAVAARIAADRHLPADWLNDGVKGFLSTRHDTMQGNLPQYPNLKVTMPVPEYLLAMKCMAARIAGPTGGQSDTPDIQFLIHHLELKSANEVLEIVARYYPSNRIPVKAQYLIEGLFAEGKL